MSANEFEVDGTWSLRGVKGDVLHVTQTPQGFLVETDTDVVALLPHGAAVGLAVWINARMGGGAGWTERESEGLR